MTSGIEYFPLSTTGLIASWPADQRADRQAAHLEDAGAAGIYVRLDLPGPFFSQDFGPERLGLGGVAAPPHLGAPLVSNLDYGCHSVAKCVANP